ncbi:MAG TPA: hypothetical protein VG929_11260 [Actinomycetota bacterium]|nr:hypothetical protein [Actinomycetota bacterium]
MSRAVAGIVIAGLAMALVLGYRVGFDATALVILVILVAVGAVAVVVARRSETGAAGPVTCRSCGGLLSPNAPYCKHCGDDVRT